MRCFSFDIETIPDTEFGRRMWDLGDLSDEDVGNAMTFRQLQKSGSDFLPLHQHRIVAISVALRMGDSFRLWSLGDEDADEAELVRRFYDGIERYTPDLVSWNGSGFDLPVLHYRALKHGIQAPTYWEQGDNNREFRFSNYLNRFHWRHIDLMDVLAGFQVRGRASLDQAADGVSLNAGPTADPMTFALVMLLMCAVGLAATFFPAWRATRAGPLAAVRHL